MKKKNLLLSLLLWNCVHLFELFPSLIPLWAYRKAQVRCIPGDAKSQHQTSRQTTSVYSQTLAELLPWWKYHTEQSSKVSLSHFDPLSESCCRERPYNVNLALSVMATRKERESPLNEAGHLQYKFLHILYSLLPCQFRSSLQQQNGALSFVGQKSIMFHLLHLVIFWLAMKLLLLQSAGSTLERSVNTNQVWQCSLMSKITDPQQSLF